MQYEDEIVGKDAGGKQSPEEQQNTSDRKESLGKNALLLLRDIAIAIGVIILILQFVKPTIVFEHSMENTLHPEDYVFLARQAYTFGEIQHGDIIVFESNLLDERGVKKNLIKRVIGLPGDVLSIHDDAVYRNDERLYEPYTRDGVTLGEMTQITVPADAIFVMGDNREKSTDSRSEEVGFIPVEKVSGKVVFRLFPISSAGRVG
jgi:signal peptidase I